MHRFDHALVFVRPGAPEASALEARGLPIGRRRTHPGQGTANACILFQNAMLELLWIENEVQARSPTVERLRLWERSRWRLDNACPFGIALHTAEAREAKAPFPWWNYEPSFAPPGKPLRVAQSCVDATEPLLFTVPVAYQPPDEDLPFAQRRVTAVSVQVRALRSDSMLRTLALPDLAFTDGTSHRLEIQLDRGRDGESLDLGPDIPIRLRW